VWAACESGLDFSSRWFKDGNDLKTVRASDIIPVDLNVFVTLNEQILSKFASHLEIFDKSKSYGNLASQRSSFLLTNLYNANMKQWNDFIISEKKLNENYYPSNFVPLLLLP
jgi:alpha,alpha-trehalase